MKVSAAKDTGSNFNDSCKNAEREVVRSCGKVCLRHLGLDSWGWLGKPFKEMELELNSSSDVRSNGFSHSSTIDLEPVSSAVFSCNVIYRHRQQAVC